MQRDRLRRARSSCVERLCAVFMVCVPGAPKAAADAGALGDDLRRHEFQMIIDTLRAERGRRKEAAERLGISPRALRYKLAQMRDAGMDVEGYLFAS